MATSHVLAIDAGTTGITALVLDQDRRLQGQAYAEFTQHYPQRGWVEHDASEILATALTTARKALKAAGIKKADAVGITNQRETTVVWDKATGKPIHNAIVWQDRRTSDACEDLRKKWAKPIREKTGLVLDPYFSATKLAWLLREIPAAREKAKSGKLLFGTIDSWLAWNLTGGHVTDVTNASRTMLWNIHDSEWDEELIELWAVPEGMLPEVVPSGRLVGDSKLGPVASLVGDQQSALFGQHCTTKGQAKNTYGTGCFLLQHTGTAAVQSKNGLITTRAASLDRRARYALEGSVFIGGAAIQWLRDSLGVIPSAPAINDVAADDADGVTVVPAFTGLGAPHWDPDARGAILGLTRGSGVAEIARATLESIALQSYDLVKAMEKDSGQKIPELRVDGGASLSEPLMRFQADVLQRPVVRPHRIETTALGTAYLAGIATDTWDAVDLAQDPVTRIAPGMKRTEARKRIKQWHHAVHVARSFKP